MNVNQIAFCASTTLATATIAITFAAVTAVALPAKVALIALAVLSGSASGASVTAWMDQRSIDATSYFSNLKEHSAYAVASMTQLTAQILVQSVIQGLANGVSTSTRRWVAGPDITIETKKKA